MTTTPATFSPDQIIDKLIIIVSEQSGLPATVDSDLINQLGLDSLDCVELTMMIEAEFDIPPFDYEPTMVTVKDLERHVIQALDRQQKEHTGHGHGSQ